MLKELRVDEPMLVAFKKALMSEKIVGKRYADPTIKSYSWHVRNFVRYCHAHKLNPKTLSNGALKKYLRSIQKNVEAGEVTRGFFSQACTSLEIFFYTLQKRDKADAIPLIRSNLVS